jgi:hypothetical protein
MHQPPYCLNSNSCAFVSTLSRITLHFRVPCFWTIWWSLAVSSKLYAFSDYWFQVFHFSSSNDVKVIWQRKCCMLQPFVRIRTAQNFTSIYPKCGALWQDFPLLFSWVCSAHGSQRRFDLFLFDDWFLISFVLDRFILTKS